MTRLLLRAVAVAALGLGACAHTPRGFTSAATGVTVVDAAEARGLHGRPFVVALPQGLDPATATTRFLRAARAEGAAFVSDLTFTSVGTAERCTARVRPVDHGGELALTVVVPDHVVERVEWRTIVHQVRESPTSPSHPEVATEQVFVQEDVPGGWREEKRWQSNWKLDREPARCAPAATTTPANLVYATIYAAP
jgi:hypothetical protein